MRKHILITGGCGYIGSALTHRMMNEKVVVADSKLYGQGGHANYGDIDEIKDAKQFDVIIHLAAISNQLDCIKDPGKCFENNLDKTVRLANQARPDVRFIFASSTAIYGDQQGKHTDQDKLKSTFPYPISKYKAEKELRERLNNLAILRLGTVWGLSPFMRPHLLVHELVSQAVYEGKILLSHKNTTRPYVHISDVVDLLINLIDLDWCGKMDVGTETMTKLELAEKIKKQTGCKIVDREINIPTQDFYFKTPSFYTGNGLHLLDEQDISGLVNYYEIERDHPKYLAD